MGDWRLVPLLFSAQFLCHWICLCLHSKKEQQLQPRDVDALFATFSLLLKTEQTEWSSANCPSTAISRSNNLKEQPPNSQLHNHRIATLCLPERDKDKSPNTWKWGSKMDCRKLTPTVPHKYTFIWLYGVFRVTQPQYVTSLGHFP